MSSNKLRENLRGLNSTITGHKASHSARKTRASKADKVGASYGGMGGTYEYFCGANVQIKINGIFLLDVAGLSYNVMDSMTPIYGYSSRLFDAVAPGQKLVQGSFVVNFRESNYVYRQMKLGRSQRVGKMREAMKASEGDAGRVEGPTPNNKPAKSKVTRDDLRQNAHEVAAAKIQNWGVGGSSKGPLIAPDPTLAGPAEIEILYGGAEFGVKTTIYGVHLIGHAHAIQIDENVLLEEYNFLGRDLVQSGSKHYN